MDVWRAAEGPGGTLTGFQTHRRSQIADLEAQKRKLFDLYYADQITPDSFHAEDQRLTTHLAALSSLREATPRTVEPVGQFDHVVELLAELDWDAIWTEATDTEKRTLLDEFVPTSTSTPTTSKSKSAAHPPSTSHSTKSASATSALRTVASVDRRDRH